MVAHSRLCYQRICDSDIYFTQWNNLIKEGNGDNSIMKSLCKENHESEVPSSVLALSLWLENQHQEQHNQLGMGSFTANSIFNCHLSQCCICNVIPRKVGIGQLFVSSCPRLWRRFEEVLCTPSHAQMVNCQPFLSQGGGMGNGESWLPRIKSYILDCLTNCWWISLVSTWAF